MTLYSVQYSEAATRDIERLKKGVGRKLYLRVLSACTALETDRSIGVKKLAGHDNVYRVRVRDYRIVFSVNNQRRIVMIEYVEHRREVYRRF